MRIVVAALVVLVITVGCGDVREPGGELAVATADDFVREGSVVSGSGRVVAIPGRPVRLCANVPARLGGYLPGQEPAPASCEFGVDVVGVALDTLANRRVQDNAVEGWATLTGVWRGEALEVHRQDPPPGTGSADERAASRNQIPPCPEPTGGWPRGAAGDNLESAQSAIEHFLFAYPESREFSALLRPSRDQVVFGVAVHDDQARAAAERDLRPVLGARLCVTNARFSLAKLEAVRSDPALQVGRSPDRPFASGTEVSDDLHPVQALNVVMITERLRRAAGAHPAGLIKFYPSVAVV